jgi:glutaredoxin
MQPFRISIVVALLATASVVVGQAQAAPFKWIDENGRVVYGDRPPDNSARPLSSAGFVQRPSGDLATLPAPLRDAARRAPVMLFTGRNCEPCQAARDHLNTRGIPFTEKTLTTEADVQAFRTLGYEAMAVPSLQVGRQRLTGFDAASWRQALDEAGYPARATLPSTWQAPEPSPLAQPSGSAAAAPKGQVVERVVRDTSPPVLDAPALIGGRSAIRF